MDQLLSILTVLAALGSAIIGGVFFAFSSFIMKALGRLPAPRGIAAMQSINIVVIRPSFLFVFLGTALACAALAIASLFMWGQPGALFRLGGAVLYLAGTFGVTMAFNVPRNNVLAAANPESEQGQAIWSRYQAEWTAWNHVRTAAALAATAAFILPQG